MEPTRAAKHQPYTLLSLIAIGAVTFFVGLGSLAFIGPDEPRYAEAAREMFVTGDYISPRLAGCLWFEKPVLLYWLAAVAYHVAGVSEFAARLPSALAAMATVLLIFFMLRQAISERLAFIVSLVLATSGIFIGFARAAVFDMALTAAMSASIFSAYFALKSEGRAQALHCYASFAALGLAMLAKGLVGIALVFAIMAVYSFIIGRARAVRWQKLLAGLVVLIAVASIWYLPVTLRHGWEFIDKFFIEHHFKRYITNTFSHPQPLYLYPLVIVGGVMPWTFLLLSAFARLRSIRPRESERDSLLTLAWIWVAVPLIFFSLSKSKLPGYILPIFPALAIILGVEAERIWNGERGRLLSASAWATAILLIALGISFFLVVSGTIQIEQLNSSPVSFSASKIIFQCLPLACAASAVFALAGRKPQAFILMTAAVVMSVIIGTVVLLFPSLNQKASLKSLSVETADALKHGERIAFFLKKEFAPVFYAQGRVVCGVGGGTILNALHPDRLVPVLESESSIILITTTNWIDDLEADSRFLTEFVASQGEALAVRVSLKR